MDVMPIQVVLLVSFPEAMLVAALGFRLLGISLRWRHLMTIGIFQALMAWVVRALPLPFGLHTIILAAVFSVIIWLVTRVPYRVAAIGALIGLVIYIVIEFIVITTISRVTGLTPFSMMAGGWVLRVLFFLPPGLIILLLLVVLSVSRVKLFDLGKGVYY